MEINPTYQTIGSIFEQNFLFEVPKYQRYYAWDDEQIDDFIKDIDSLYEDKSSEHFFGGIVCVKKTVVGSNRQQRELIDGQQRITTTVLVILNIIKSYNDLKSETNLSIVNSRIEKLKQKYLEYDDEINRIPLKVPKLVLSNADKNFFDNLVNTLQVPTVTRESHNKISKAFNKIGKYINRLLRNKSKDDKIDCLGKLENIIHNNCSIIFIDTDTREAAYKLFQVLNDRGTGLTAGDLLKSKTLESLEKHYQTKQTSLANAWDEILQEGTNYAEVFLRTYYASYFGTRAGRASLYDDFLGKVFPYLLTKESIKEESEANQLIISVNSILDEYKKYTKLINGDWPYEYKQPVTEWDRRRLYVLTNFLDYDIVMPLLLAATKLDHKIFAQIVFALEKFMFRYKGITNNSHQKASSVFMLEASKIRSNANYSVSSLFKILREIIESDANDKIFAAAISELKYKQNGGNKFLRYFFNTLNDYYAWYSGGQKGRPIPSKTITDFENVTLEHIFAENSVEKNPIGVDINKLQNLTILTHKENNDAANSDFLKKKPILEHSEYEINKYFSNVSSWDKTNSENWLNMLIEMALKIFVI